jgi:CpeT/CpcT family (DUF1001)
MKRTVAGGRAIWFLALALAAAIASGGAKMKDSDVELIAQWFAGTYDTAPLAGASESDGHVLVIERVSSPMISWHVFYAEERNVLGIVIAQQLLSLELANDKKSIVERSFRFKEPQRWHGGLERPDIFKSIIADDLTVASGCEIFWFRDKKGFAGKTTPHSCRLRSVATGDSVEVDIKARLTPAEFVYGERTFRKRAVGTQ